jgi:hypothetical protein
MNGEEKEQKRRREEKENKKYLEHQLRWGSFSCLEVSTDDDKGSTRGEADSI